MGEVVRPTGVYVPHSADATPRLTEALTDPENESTDAQGNSVSHVLAGDFNQYTRKRKNGELFHEWLGDAGSWELSDPDLPTHRKGSTMDKFMLLPGTNKLEEWPPLETSEWRGVEDNFVPCEHESEVSLRHCSFAAAL